MAYETLSTEIDEGVCILTLNRPDLHNAMNQVMFTELHTAARELEHNEEVRAVVMTGAGKSFSSGLDLTSFAGLEQLSALQFYKLLKGFQASFLAYEMMNKPVIAAANGLAFGAALELILACDIRFSCPEASFGLLEIKFGIIPDLVSCRRLARLIGMGYAKELICTGDTVSGKEAHRMGFIEHLVPQEEVLPEAMKLAKRLADGPILGIAIAKQVVNRCWDSDPETALEFEAIGQTLCLISQDHKEAVSAFMEGRKPRYTGA
jgi:enoyl-CoA hydratase/carnithine racemase